MENEEEKQEKKRKDKKQRGWVWPVKVLFLAIFLSFSFSILSELALSNAVLIVSIIVVLVFILISIVFDMLGVAVTSSSIEPFLAMASRKVTGSKQAISLIKNADRISAICTDVIGDICGILSGAAGASILGKIAISGDFNAILVSSLVSALIAGITIFGKACCKKYAITHSNEVTLRFAKFINIFTKKDKK